MCCQSRLSMAVQHSKPQEQTFKLILISRFTLLIVILKSIVTLLIVILKSIFSFANVRFLPLLMHSC